VRVTSTARRVSAVVAILSTVAVVAITVLALLGRPLPMLTAAVCLGVAIGAAAYALTRTGARRTIAAIVAVLALVAPILLVVALGQVLQLLAVIALVVIAVVATRHALGGDTASVRSGPSPVVEVGPAARPVLILNPRSGGGKVER